MFDSQEPTPEPGDSPVDLLDALLAADPGPAAISGLAGLDPSALDDEHRLAVLRAWERQLAWMHAAQQPWLAAVGGVAGVDDWGREEVAAALRLSCQTAQRRLEAARALCSRLTATADALRRGDIGYWHAAFLTTAVAGLDDHAAHRVEACVLPKAADKTLADFRRAVTRAVATADPIGFELAHAEARTTRGTRVYDEGFGMSTVATTVPSEDVRAVMGVLDAMADQAKAADLASGAPRRTLDQRRADAFVDIFSRLSRDPSLPGADHKPSCVNVTVDLGTLLGLADHPGQLDNGDVIPASVARELARDAEWRRFVTDPLTGELLDRSPDTYRPSVALHDFDVARDRVCEFPGCNQPARRGHIDHIVPFDPSEGGGKTTRWNTGALCPRHHRLKHEAGWQLCRNKDGSLTWTSPMGATYVTAPPSYHPDG